MHLDSQKTCKVKRHPWTSMLFLAVWFFVVEYNLVGYLGGTRISRYAVHHLHDGDMDPPDYAGRKDEEEKR